MKRIIFLFLFLTFIVGLKATNWIAISDNTNFESDIQLVNTNSSQSTIEFNLSGFWYNEVETDRGTAWRINIDGAANRLLKGSPALPLFATSVVIPANAKMKVEVISSTFIEYNDVLIAPSKGNFDRTIDPESVAFEYGPQYNRNEFFPTKITDLRKPYIIRDFRGQTVLINPFSYNAVTKTLRVYYNIILNVSEDGISNINTLSTDAIPESIDKSFSKIYKQHFINYQFPASRYVPVDDQGKMLIISYGDFMDEMDAFIDWKTKTGTFVEIVDVAEIGGAPQIKTYIADYYTDNGLTFVLLVGDAMQVPSSVIGGNDSDIDYSYIIGDDHYPDLFVGRFSAENIAHVTTMVERTIAYERTPEELTWYENAIGIASDQGPGDDNELDYEHIRNIQDNKLIPFTYNYGYEFYDGSQGGEDENNNPTPSQVATAINSGASIINYTGHGSNTSWGTSGFSSNDVNSLTNTEKFPFIISVACVNGNFVNTTCFAEAWLRAEDNGNPTGAVATLMSTINQSWNPPMQGQDDMNDILAEADENNIKRTFGGITMNGCMGMNDEYGSAGDEMTDTWIIFGDPSLMIRTATPQIMTVTHSPTILAGASSLTVICDAEGALAALTMDGEIIGTAIVEGGSAIILFDPLVNIGIMDLVITAFNYIPNESTVEIIPAAGPYIVYAGNLVNDESGNNNGQVDYYESILLTISLSNSGTENANGVNSTISTDNEFVTITDNTELYGNILIDDTVAIENGFAFDVDNNIPDGESININITAEDNSGRELWESNFSIIAHAPVLNFESFTIDDNSGNQNGIIDPGETVDLIVEISNTGSSEAFNIMGILESINEYITINSFEISYGDIAGGESNNGIFNITASDDTPEGTNVEFDLSITADYNILSFGNFSTFVGQKPVLIIDFSAETSSADDMMECFTELNVGADQSSEILSDAVELYKSVFIILGVYPNNHVLTTEEGDVLSQYLDDGGRIYMEGGDTWAFDNQTAVHEKFMINGLADGDGDLSRIIGFEGNMLQGYAFNYDGINNYIDRIEPQAGATIILENESPDYATAISFANETYKTIGSTACFGGLTDEDGSTKDGLMAEYLYFFNVNYIWTDINKISLIENNVRAYPNPFNNFVNISVDLTETQTTEIVIYNLNGKKIATLANETLQSGNHIFRWDTKSSPSGIYFYSIKYGNNTYTKKLILNK